MRSLQSVPLEQVAEIKTGLTLRGPNAASPVSGHGPHYLRISDITKEGRISIREIDRINVTTESVAKQRLQKNDVVLANRGNRLPSALFDQDLDAVAGSQFYVLRATTPSILPEFLRWFLNLDETTTYLLAQSTGSYIKSLPIGELRKLAVPIPSLDVQRRIVTVAELRLKEQELAARLENLKETRLQHSLRRAASTTVPHSHSNEPTQHEQN